jgi:FixJ family two-component response regulator
MDATQPLVLVVDDDESVRRSLRWLLTSAGYAVATFSSGSDMLEHRPDQPAILLIDVRMPDMTGLEVKEKLVGTGRDMVTVFITGHDDVAIGVEAMKSGAEDFLLKPFEATDVLDAVQRAISRHRANQEARFQVADIGGQADRRRARYVRTDRQGPSVARNAKDARVFARRPRACRRPVPSFERTDDTER